MAEGTGLSAADVMALTRDNDTFGENWIWIIGLLIIAGIFGGGFGMFGGNGNASTSNLQTAELYSALGSQDIKNDVRSGFQTVIAGQNNLNTQILDNKFTTQLGFQNISQQMCECCNNLEKTVIQENNATRELMNQHYINELADKLSVSRNQVSNLEQNQYLLSTIGRYNVVSVPPCGCINSGNCSY